jgi:hypothetical protein
VFNAPIVVKDDEAYIVEYLSRIFLWDTAPKHVHEFEKPGIGQILWPKDLSPGIAVEEELARAFSFQNRLYNSCLSEEIYVWIRSVKIEEVINRLR